MMRLLLVTGFLGSGKTTFIIKLAQELIRSNKKVAILINEIGDIGIDDQLMRQLDLDIWELLGGCICCTLAGDLVAALTKIDQDFDVDLVLMEPSGAAEPGNILSALPYYQGSPLKSIRTIALLDPLRISHLYRVLTPLITRQVASADLILLTKTDLASNEEIESARRIAAEINPAAAPMEFSDKSLITGAILGELLR